MTNRDTGTDTDSSPPLAAAARTSGVLQQYLSDLRQSGEAGRDGGRGGDVLLPYVLSPLHLVAMLATARLWGQAAHLMYSLLALPAALFSTGLARQHLASHLKSSQLPFALTRLVETAESAAERKREREGGLMGWEYYAQECAHYSSSTQQR